MIKLFSIGHLTENFVQNMSDKTKTQAAFSHSLRRLISKIKIYNKLYAGYKHSSGDSFGKNYGILRVYIATILLLLLLTVSQVCADAHLTNYIYSEPPSHGSEWYNQLIKFELLTQSIRRQAANRQWTRLSVWPRLQVEWSRKNRFGKTLNLSFLIRIKLYNIFLFLSILFTQIL